MNYSVSQFRANMWAILDETRYERKITTIGRRNKQEFVVIPMDIFKTMNTKEVLIEIQKYTTI
jgi:PHD/YefM family antitoxin component YafN of YafNO toxin-antitoxin module